MVHSLCVCAWKLTSFGLLLCASQTRREDFNMYSKVNPASVYSTSDAFFYFSSNINKVEPSPPQNFTEVRSR